jgi:hypothetical protein
MPNRKKAPRRATRSRPAASRPAGFVGREGSPVLDKYPPKDPSLTVRGPPVPGRHGPEPTPAPTPAAAAPSAPQGGAPGPLIRLDAPFDIDEFASMLGENSIRVTVPREDLDEVLKRVTDFMGFGIYVYSISVRPAPSDQLKGFVVELQRVDYSAEKGAWIAFQEKGTSDSPFGPTGTRT